LLLLIWYIAFVAVATAHEVRPAFLELTEHAPGEFDVLWKVPAVGGAPLAGEEIPHQSPALLDDPGASRTMPCGCPAPTLAQLSRGVLPIHPSLPKDAVTVALPRSERIFGAEVKRWTIRVPRGLEGWEVGVHGLSATVVDVLVRVAFKDGRVVSRLLRPDAPSFVFTRETAGPAAGGYFVLGVEHILFGIDHLLFVLALVLIVRGAGLLVKTITAFTVAHSITLALATLGVVHVPSAPVEAVIALSIVFVASEIVRIRSAGRLDLPLTRPAATLPPTGGYVVSAPVGLVAQICNLLYRRFVIGRASDGSSVLAVADAPQNAILRYGRLQICATQSGYTGGGGRGEVERLSLTARAPWLVAGLFGLLHGFGFAGALSQVGLPANDIPLALLFFNLGVEAGQLAFVVVTLGMIALLRRLRLPEWSPLLPPYAIGSVAMFWVIQRIAVIW
jgi:hydrogenase/urease accessory protein HupE